MNRPPASAGPAQCGPAHFSLAAAPDPGLSRFNACHRWNSPSLCPVPLSGASLVFWDVKPCCQPSVQARRARAGGSRAACLPPTRTGC